MKKDIFKLSRIAKMYYIDKVKQNVIAEKFGLTPMMVSRALREAEMLGIVEINIKMPWKLDLQVGKEVKEKYGLNECIVLDLKTGESIQVMLARYLTEYFISILKDNMTIGISWGRTILRFVEALPAVNVTGCKVVPLSGTFLGEHYETTPTGIMQKLAQKLNAEVYSVNAPLYTADKEMKEKLGQDYSNQIAIGKAAQADVNIIGIGILELENLVFRLGILNRWDRKELLEARSIGDVAGNYIDADGNLVNWNKKECYTGVPLDKINQAKEVICVAGGIEKEQVVRVAASKSYFKTLITEKQLALRLIK